MLRALHLLGNVSGIDGRRSLSEAPALPPLSSRLTPPHSPPQAEGHYGTLTPAESVKRRRAAKRSVVKEGQTRAGEAPIPEITPDVKPRARRKLRDAVPPTPDSLTRKRTRGTKVPIVEVPVGTLGTQEVDTVIAPSENGLREPVRKINLIQGMSSCPVDPQRSRRSLHYVEWPMRRLLSLTLFHRESPS